MLDPADTLSCILHALGAAPLLPLVSRPPGRPPIPADKDSILGTSMLRRALYERILAEPGITATKIKQELDMLEGTFANHVEKLERADLIDVRLLLGARCLYPTGTAPDTREGVFTSPTQRDVAVLVLAHPEGIGSGIVAQTVGVTQRMAQRHLWRLMGRRLVIANGGGPSTTYAPTAKLRKLLQPTK